LATCVAAPQRRVAADPVGRARIAGDKKLATFTFVGLFQPPWLRNTVAATIMSFAATVGFWGTQTWIPARAPNWPWQAVPTPCK